MALADEPWDEAAPEQVVDTEGPPHDDLPDGARAWVENEEPDPVPDEDEVQPSKVEESREESPAPSLQQEPPPVLPRRRESVSNLDEKRSARRGTQQRVMPGNAQVERALVGALLLKPENDELWAAAASVSPAHCYDVAVGEVYAAMLSLKARGEPIDAVLVAAELGQRLDLVGGPGGIAAILSATGSTTPGSVAAYARVIGELYRERQLIALVAQASEAAWAGDVQGVRVLGEQIAAVSPAVGPEADPSLDDLLKEDEPEYDWLVPDLIERGDRVILTAAEGGGKSTLLRQMAIRMAAGQHPFSGEAIPPVRVFYLDLENSKRQFRRKIRGLRVKLGDRLDSANFVVKVQPEGIDLSRAEDQMWLEERIAANRPDFLAIGPIYKMASGDPTEEKTAKPVAELLDRLRVRYGFALAIEAHSAKATGKFRPETPYGASLWMRWPEFGLFLSPEGQLRPWRGGRDERRWPILLKPGGEWPWSEVIRKTDVTWAAILSACREEGKRLSYRALASRLGGDVAQIQRAVAANRKQWDEIAGEDENDEREAVDK